VIVVELPTGTVAPMFTDIEGSTRMLRSRGGDDATAWSDRRTGASV
jgi:hypothetical protein